MLAFIPSAGHSGTLVDTTSLTMRPARFLTIGNARLRAASTFPARRNRAAAPGDDEPGAIVADHGGVNSDG